MNNVENMTRLCSLVVAISLVCLVSVIQSKDSCGPYSWGKDFYVAFLGQRNPSKRYGRVQTDNYEISLSIRSTSFGSLHVFFLPLNQSLTYNITKGDSTVKLPSTLLQNYTSAIQPKGVQLTSNVPVAITATVSCKNCRNVDVLHYGQLLPVLRLSKHYIVGKPGLGINIVALQKSRFNITYAVNDKTRDITGELKPFDSYILNDSHDTGLRSISSTEPIAVFLYSRNSGYAEHISGRTAGHKFIIPSTTYYTAKLRVSALQDETFIRTTVGSETIVMKLDEGKYIESDLKATVILSSSKPIEVMLDASHYFPSPTRITYLPDVSQFAQEYSLDISNTYMTYVTIITPTAYEKQLLFSEPFIPEWIQTDHVVLDGATYFIATTKLSGKGIHNISMADPSGRFGGIVGVIERKYIRGLYLLGMPLGGC